MKRLGSDRAWQDGSREPKDAQNASQGSRPAADNDEPQTKHREDEGRKKHRSARALHVVARMVVACQKQSGQALIFQVTPDKLICSFLPRDARPDVGNLMKPLRYDAGMRTIEQNEGHQRESVGQPYLEDAEETALCGC